jgi:hypothetical protein
VFQETVENTAGTHLVRDRRHRFVNNFRLTILAGLLGQTQIAEIKPCVFGPGRRGWYLLAREPPCRLPLPGTDRPVSFEGLPKPYEIAQAGMEKRRN